MSLRFRPDASVSTVRNNETVDFRSARVAKCQKIERRRIHPPIVAALFPHIYGRETVMYFDVKIDTTHTLEISQRNNDNGR